MRAEQGSGPLPNSAGNSPTAARNSAAGQHTLIIGEGCKYIRVLSSRGRFSGPDWIFSLLSGRCAVAWFGALLLAIPAMAHAQSVLTYHRSPDRSGNYVVPA